jgi:hypothetical protein
MDVEFTPEAQAVDDKLYDTQGTEYESLWSVLDRIRKDSEEAKHANWTNYVSTRDLWGSKILGTDYTVFWRVSPGPVLTVALIVRDKGL